jgi:hypothetical protein
MAITKNNFSHVTNTELEGVEITFIKCDFKNSMASETGDVTSGSATAGLELVRNTFAQEGFNIIGEGNLANTNTTKTYMVRADALDTLSSTTSIARLQAAIRALNGGDNITQTVSGTDVTEVNLSA